MHAKNQSGTLCARVEIWSVPTLKKPFVALTLALLAMSVCAQDAIIAPVPLNDVLATKPQGIKYEAESLFDSTATAAEAEPISGAWLLAECASRMPLEPLSMTGTLTMRKVYGVELRKYNYVVAIHWGAAEPRATYEILTTNNERLETVVAVRKPEGALELSRFEGKDRRPTEAPAINATVRGTDITWLDITLDFVWWQNPILSGTGKVKGRLCDILEVEPAAPMENCAKVRLWIDREQKLVMQAAQVDEKGREVRKMWVRAVQKIDTRWVLKDIEVETLGSGHRTRLHVEDVQSGEAATDTDKQGQTKTNKDD